RVRAAVDWLRDRGLRGCPDADQALAPLAAEHRPTDDRGALGSSPAPPVLHPTAPARDAVPRCGWGILGTLYANGNHLAAAARPVRENGARLPGRAIAPGPGHAAWRRAPGA